MAIERRSVYLVILQAKSPNLRNRNWNSIRRQWSVKRQNWLKFDSNLLNCRRLSIDRLMIWSSSMWRPGLLPMIHLLSWFSSLGKLAGRAIYFLHALTQSQVENPVYKTHHHTISIIIIINRPSGLWGCRLRTTEPALFPGHRSQQANESDFSFFVFVLSYSKFVLSMNVCFCCVTFSFFTTKLTSQLMQGCKAELL